MIITELRVETIRGFVNNQSIAPSNKINLLIGQNNSGKSTILNSILLIQDPSVLNQLDISLNWNQGRIDLVLSGLDRYIKDHGNSAFPDIVYDKLIFEFDRGRGQIRTARSSEGATVGFGQTNNEEPKNLIYPYLSKRKVVSYDEAVHLQATHSVRGNFTHLYAKINRLCNINHPASQEYQDACKEIIGFPISPVASSGGQMGAYIIDAFKNIPLTSMGEGVPNLLGLIVDLCIAENKIFLIEEPENDIHPKALKALLELIARKSETNQFFISTHSNIVTKYLGSVEDAKVFRVSMSFEEKLPNSKIEEVENNETARRELLEELGYEFQDYDLHKAWLFLEESSAEVVIRDFLIPTFAKGLRGKIKTFAANGIGTIQPKFDDFNRLFVFLRLEPVYKNKVWVVVDEGAEEKTILDKMKEMYGKSDWNEDNFLQLSEHDFEKYYPQTFADQINETLAIEDKQSKRTKKRELIEEIKKWWIDNPVQAKAEFKESAAEVIKILKAIEKQLTKSPIVG